MTTEEWPEEALSEASKLRVACKCVYRVNIRIQEK